MVICHLMDRKYLFVAVFLIVFAFAGGIYIVSSKNAKPVKSPLPTPVASGTIGNSIKIMEDGLKIEDKTVGTGAEAMAGKKVTVNYIGTLTSGAKFDSSFDRNEPFSFNLGAGEVIKGWDEGVVGMKVGGKRQLTIPSTLAYGDAGVPGAIPGGATLIFEVELLKVE